MAKKKQGLPYSVVGINELALSIPLVEENLYQQFDHAKLNFTIALSFSDKKVQEDKIAVKLDITYLYEDNQEADPKSLLFFSGEVIYKILNIKKYADKDIIHLPKDILAVLTGITFSTIRGMIAVRTIGKFQGQFFLPVIDPKELVDDYIASNK